MSKSERIAQRIGITITIGFIIPCLTSLTIHLIATI